MQKIKQAVILAGGRGSRLGRLTSSIPKPMILINKKPFLEYLVRLLKENGIEEIIFLLGYKGQKIIDYLGDGKKFGLKLSYSVGSVDDQTGTRIKKAAKFLDSRFLLLYCDNYWPLNLETLEKFHMSHRKLATVVVYENLEKIRKNNIQFNSNGDVYKYDKLRKSAGLNGIEIGFFIINRKILKLMPSINFSFEEKIIPRLVADKQIKSFVTGHKYYSISDPERLKKMRKYFKPRKVIFLDRDGVINKRPANGSYVKRWEEFEFLPGAKDALKLLSENKYDIFLMTNQAGIGRGLMSVADLENIHRHLKRELKIHKIKIKDIYYCPHHWEENCRCRKPKTGLLFKAVCDHDINLKEALFVGDDPRDLLTGQAAGCKTIVLKPKETLLDVARSITKKNL